MSRQHTELLTWTRLPGQMPDADLTVMLNVQAESELTVWPGYWDGEQFVFADGTPIKRSAVVGWADMPAGFAA